MDSIWVLTAGAPFRVDSNRGQTVLGFFSSPSQAREVMLKRIGAIQETSGERAGRSGYFPYLSELKLDSFQEEVYFQATVDSTGRVFEKFTYFVPVIPDLENFNSGSNAHRVGRRETYYYGYGTTFKEAVRRARENMERIRSLNKAGQTNNGGTVASLLQPDDATDDLFNAPVLLEPEPWQAEPEMQGGGNAHG